MIDKSRVASARAWLGRPVDGAGLAAFRVLFALVMIGQTLRFWANGWIETQWLRPAWHFTWSGFDWVRPLPGVGMYLVEVVQLAALVMLALGRRTRIAATVFFVTFTWGELLDKALYLNHYYLVSLLALLCVVLPLSRAGGRSVPFGAYALLRGQVAVVYVFAGIAKLSSDWLIAGEPLRTWLQAHADLPVVGPWLDTPAAALAFSWAGMIHDLLIVPALLWRPTRAWAFGVAAAFHVTISLLFPVGVFSFVMLAGLTIFLEPDWPRRLPWIGRRLGGTNGTAATTVDAASGATRPLLGRASTAFGAAWMAFQIVWPLRHLAVPGDVDWHEDGFRFAWRVMVIEKSGHVDFEVRTADPPGRFVIFTRDDLTPLQDKMMSTQPDMIGDYARHLAERYRGLGYRGVAVHADAWVSLNGRPAAQIVDPRRDLAADGE